MKEYIDNNYGVCEKKEKCLCIRDGWIGGQCADWIPLSKLIGKPLNTFQDLLTYNDEIREKRNEFWQK